MLGTDIVALGLFVHPELHAIDLITSRDAPTGHKLFNFISTSLQPRRWAHIKEKGLENNRDKIQRSEQRLRSWETLEVPMVSAIGAHCCAKSPCRKPNLPQQD